MPLDHASEVDKFDRYARSYSEAHAASVRASGEAPEYFARHKLGCLLRLGVTAEQRVLDYGCGTGGLTEQLGGHFRSVSAYDPSARSLEVAKLRAPAARIYESEREIPEEDFDVAVLSGVLHHVAPSDRPALVSQVVRKLRAGGRLFVFEHNPYNPLTLRAVRACPFDDDAVLLHPGEARTLLRSAGLSAIRQDYVLFFPRPLARLRALEPWLRRCPLGAQTLTLGTRTHGPR